MQFASARTFTNILLKEQMASTAHMDKEFAVIPGAMAGDSLFSASCINIMHK